MLRLTCHIVDTHGNTVAMQGNLLAHQEHSGVA